MPRTLALRHRRLTAMLARGRLQTVASGVPAAICAGLGLGDEGVRRWPHGPVAAAGEPWPQAAVDPLVERLHAGACLAEPVVLHPHTDRVTIGDTERLRLEESEAAALAAAVASLLDADGLEVSVAAPARWYLTGASAAKLGVGLPAAAELAGARLDEALDAAGADAATAALLTELQMLLHDHPVNRERQRRGDAAVHGLWLSGGGRLPEERPRLARPIIGAHSYARGLARLAAQSVSDTAGGFGEMVNESAVAVLAPLPPARNEAAIAPALDSLDALWIRPAWRRLGQGRLARLRWWDGRGRGGELRPRDRWRIWQRRWPFPG